MGEQVLVFYYNEDQPERLDKFLAEQIPDHSRSRLQSLIREGKVRIDGIEPHKTGVSLERGARVEVRIPPPQPSGLEPEEIPLDIVFENENLLVVNKPAGMVVHPSAGHSSGTLVHAVLSHAPELEGVGGEKRPGVVHRLDKETSGLILLAKNDRTHNFLQSQFSSRKVEKIYLALVDGHPPTPTGRIEAAIGRDPHNRKKMAVLSSGRGRPSISEYHTLETFKGHTLVEVHPVTGRTHQIRLHMAFIGCPVAGDTTYGRRHPSIPLKRHFLHAAQLTIRLPDVDQPVTFRAPLPEELQTILSELRTQNK